MGHVVKRGTKWQAAYRGPDRRERTKTFARKVDAQAWLLEMEAQKAKGTWHDPAAGRLTFDRWADHYEAELSLHKRRSTRARDASVLRCHLRPAFGRLPMAAITRASVQSLVRKLQQTHAPKGVRTIFGVLHAVMEAAVPDVIPANPCRGVKLPALKRERNPRYLSGADLERLADAMPPEYRALVFVAGIMALRWSELIALRVGDVDFLRRTMRVVETTSEVEGSLTTEDVKTQAGRRVLPIPPIVIDALATHLALQPGPADVDELLFTAPGGGSLRRGNFRQRIWLPAVARAGLDGFTLRHLRHSAAGLLAQAGVHAKLIQLYLGHESSRISMDIYAGFHSAVPEEAARSVQALFDQSGSADARDGTTGWAEGPGRRG